MAKPIVVTWPAMDTAAVAKLQTTSGAGSLILNGNLALSNNGGIPLVIFNNQIRTVSLTSTGNLSGVNFTITGTNNYVVLSETIAGPSNDTVYTNNSFSTITSVTVDGAVGTNVSIGTGSSGFTSWIKYDYNVNECSLGAAIITTGIINYSVLATLDDVNTNIGPTAFPPNYLMNNADGTVIGPFGLVQANYTGTGAPTYDTPIYIKMPINFYTIQINSSSVGGSLVGTFIQQGAP